MLALLNTQQLDEGLVNSFAQESSDAIVLFMKIRDEILGDEEAIYELTKLAFMSVDMSDGREPEIVDGIRKSGDLTLSLIAIDEDEIVGHVAFSPVIISDSAGQWYGLGPISVHPQRQRAGIGAQLIEEGLKRLRSLDASGCVLLGDPIFYSRFGFKSSGDLTYGEIPKKYVQALAFKTKLARGEVRFAPAFEG